MFIYKIVNDINEYVYVGQTVLSLQERFRQHLISVKQGSKSKFHSAMRELGTEHFSIECICECNADEMDLLEFSYIVHYMELGISYNEVKGKYENPMNVLEVKQRHDEIMRSKDVRKRISDTMKAIVSERGFTEEHRSKISAKLKGNQHFKGKKLSDNHKEALAKSHYKKLAMYDENDNLEKVFNSVKEAYAYTVDSKISTHKTYTTFADAVRRNRDKHKLICSKYWKYIDV